MMASAQRPGLFGVEDPTQLVTYQGEYIQCRRIEALLAWQQGSLADVIYAARCAGVLIPMSAVAHTSKPAAPQTHSAHMGTDTQGRGGGAPV